MTEGRIVVLNGVPRSGKSSIVAAMQAGGNWVNLGVDTMMATLPEALRPGIGLRPGGERADLEPIIPLLFAALYDSIAAHCRQGFDVVADVGHHGGYATIRNPLFDCASRFDGLPALLVGVRCDLATIMARRNRGQPGREGTYETGDTVPAAVHRWQAAVHDPGIYDLELDTAVLTPAECAARIAGALMAFDPQSSAFSKLRQIVTDV